MHAFLLARTLQLSIVSGGQLPFCSYRTTAFGRLEVMGPWLVMNGMFLYTAMPSAHSNQKHSLTGEHMAAVKSVQTFLMQMLHQPIWMRPRADAEHRKRLERV